MNNEYITEVGAYKLIIKDLLILLQHCTNKLCTCSTCEVIRNTYGMNLSEPMKTFKYKAMLPNEGK